MEEKFFKVISPPPLSSTDGDARARVVLQSVWNRAEVPLGTFTVNGRKAWGGGEPIWRNEVVYYNTANDDLSSFLNTLVIHHTSNSSDIKTNEKR